jgi:protein SCO1/2
MSDHPSLLSRRELVTGRFSAVPTSSGRFVGPAGVAPHGFSVADRATLRWPDCRVRSHRDEDLRLVSDLIAGQRVILGFIYTRCDGICPTTTAHMLAAHRILTERKCAPFRMISVSVDPDRDTADDLLRYAARNGVAAIPDWHFVVAAPAETLALRRALRLVDPDPALDRKPSNHSGVLVLGNDERNRWGGIPAGAEPVHIANSFERIARTGTLQQFAGFPASAT